MKFSIFFSEMESVENVVMNDDIDIDALEEHSWVQWYQKSWLEIEEGETGLKVLNKKSKKASSNSHVSESSVPIKKGLIRFVYILIDYSSAMDRQGDYKPNRCDFLVHQLKEFLTQFFLNNPLSYVSLAAMRNGKTEIITRMTGQCEFQQKALLSYFTKTGPAGACSLTHSIDWVLRSALELPSYASRELVTIWGSLSSMDTQPLFPDFADKFKSSTFFKFTISMSPEVYAVKKLFGDSMVVVQNAAEFQTKLTSLVEPRAANPNVKPVYVKMGFPIRRNNQYICPQCGAFCMELPANCVLCQLTLVNKDMLTRVHRLLYEVPATVDVDTGGTCFGCDTDMGETECVACKKQFCQRCESFINNKLKHCPGCLC